MLKPNEHKSVQARILKYAEEIGWTFVSQGEAEPANLLRIIFIAMLIASIVGLKTVSHS
ncbi:MAG: hypothetical protein LBG15_14980 [Dysgonamonadaceae bacterium]|jgi:hypothetical protein|nr:hypothetical protein [Dysgonamonadaceae bacterium]